MNRFFLRLVAACLAAVLLVPAAVAQQRTAVPPVTEGHLVLAREVVNITGVSALFDAFLPQFGAQIRQNMVTRPELTKDLDQVLDKLNPELEQQKQVMVDLSARYFANRFTEAELKELITFFKTPLGQKYLDNAPRILDALAVETQRWTSVVAQNLMTRVREEMGKRGHQM